MPDDDLKANDKVSKHSDTSQCEHTEVVAAQSQVGAEHLELIESTRSNMHSGSAGGSDESIQIEAVLPSGEKRIVSRSMKGNESNLLSDVAESKSFEDLKVAAENNVVLQPVKKLREYAESLPENDPNKESLKNLAREQFNELSRPPKYVHLDSEHDAGVFRISAIENQIVDENTERFIGATIGVADAIGSLTIDLATVADFAAVVIIGDKQRAGEMGASLGESIGKSLVVGQNLFTKSYDYLYNLGFEGNATKPVSDVCILGQVLERKFGEFPRKNKSD